MNKKKFSMVGLYTVFFILAYYGFWISKRSHGLIDLIDRCGGSAISEVAYVSPQVIMD